MISLVSFVCIIRIIHNYAVLYNKFQLKSQYNIKSTRYVQYLLDNYTIFNNMGDINLNHNPKNALVAIILGRRTFCLLGPDAKKLSVVVTSPLDGCVVKLIQTFMVL